MIFDDLVEEWQHRNRPPPDPGSPEAVAAEQWWTWHDRARAMTHTLYADRGWQILVAGPISDDLPISGVAMIEAGVAAERPDDDAAIAGAVAGIAQALTDVRATLTAAYATLPRPVRPVWSGPIPLPPEDQ